MRYPFIALIILVPVQALAADLMDRAAETGSFDHFTTLIERAGLEDELNDGRPRTVFMPTDAAFARLPPQSFRDLMAAGPEALRRIVRHHVVADTAFPSDDLPRTLRTADGGVLRVTWQRGDLTLFSDPRPIAGEAARVVLGDVDAGSGVIHGVDAVMLPMAALDVQPPAPEIAERPTATPVPEPEPQQPEPEQPEPEPTVIAPVLPAVEPAGNAAEPKRNAETEFLTELPPASEPPSEPASGTGQPRQSASPNGNGDESGTVEHPARLTPARLTVERLKDMTVTSSDGQREGVVEHVVFSPETGRIRLVLVRFSSFLGLFGKVVALPWEQVQVALGKPLLIAGMSADDIESAEEASLDSLGLN